MQKRKMGGMTGPNRNFSTYSNKKEEKRSKRTRWGNGENVEEMPQQNRQRLRSPFESAYPET